MCRWEEEKFMLKLSRNISTEENTLQTKAFVGADKTIVFRSLIEDIPLFFYNIKYIYI